MKKNIPVIISFLSLGIIFSVISLMVPAYSEGTHEDTGDMPLTNSIQPDYNVVVNRNCSDHDRDELCTRWERYSGLYIYYAGRVYFYGCGYYGPDPVCPKYYQKDIYVEIDWMKDHAPNQTAIDNVIEAFANRGITLHVQLDEEIDWHKTILDVYSSIGGTHDNEFDIVKQNYFGTAAERAKADPTENRYLTLKRQAFHYGLFVHQTQDFTSSGNAEIIGNDFIISLGTYTNQVGNVEEQAGTLMHELGHNLGLLHGGPLFDASGSLIEGPTINCKPNYPSVMNFAYQFGDLVPNRPLDFSSGDLETLDENSLNETAGVGAAGIGMDIVYGPSSPLTVTVPSNGSINWNRDGDSIDAGIALDLNNLGIAGCDVSSPGEILNDHDDWGSLDYDFKQEGNFDD